jgi:hypothetical protein
VSTASLQTATRHDRAVGLACLIACPAISGLFVGVVAAAIASASGRENAAASGLLVAAIVFVANACAICLAARGAYRHAVHRANA